MISPKELLQTVVPITHTLRDDIKRSIKQEWLALDDLTELGLRYAIIAALTGYPDEELAVLFAHQIVKCLVVGRYFWDKDEEFSRRRALTWMKKKR
jgi:hypothetical protein